MVSCVGQILKILKNKIVHTLGLIVGCTISQLKIAPTKWPKFKILISELMTPSGGLRHVLQKEKIAFNQAQI